ncbi:hypothetical protein QAD02_006070 [Eretmocerus hayati]|uniref:Uncharacterized protein n=1 Tax=Eretmocerus hayati TaxID=131215 RepID=A0ACC2N0D4_9HYME|nr:hypothetical protein QAD02_006070 [Eretmocerus hayati]
MFGIVRTSLKLFLIWVLFAQHVVADVTRSEKSSKSWKNITDSNAISNTPEYIYRLPQLVKPVGYRLNVVIRVGNFGQTNLDFQGIVEIDVVVEKATDEIILHSKGLTISKYLITKFGEGEKLYSISKIVLTDLDFVVFKRTLGNFEVGMYTIAIAYHGDRQNDQRSLFVRSYKDDKGNKGWYAATNFEPIGARSVFPCFDEPGFKAKFNISITHNETFSANSNTWRISISGPDPHRMVTTSFEETPRMSTYSIAFFVSNFNTDCENDGVLRILTRQHSSNNTEFSLLTGRFVLDTLGKYTGIPYSKYAKKMDVIAVPDEDFDGTKSWGIALYKENVLLFNEANGEKYDKRPMIVKTISSALAHQWFGNLVSPKWWKSVWLTQGISSFFAQYIAAKINPQWRSAENFVVQDLFTTLLRDDVDREALNFDPVTAEQIEPVLEFSRDKGAVIIRMMQHFLTDAVLQSGLRNYLNKKAGDAADSDDLFQAIDEVAQTEKMQVLKPFNLAKVMSTWINCPGYPLITVTRNYHKNSIHLNQENYVLFDDGTKKKCIWNIPINYATTKDMNFTLTTPEFWLTNTSLEITTSASAGDWILLNKQVTGYYRVNYDENNWHLIINYMKSSKKSLLNIHQLNRAQLFNDALILMNGNRLSLSILLKLITILEQESDYIVWISALNTIEWLRPVLVFTQYYPIFEEYLQRIERSLGDEFEHSLQEAMYNGGTVPLATYRTIYFDHNSCSSDEDLKNFISWVTNKISSPYDTAPWILCCDYRAAKDGEWSQLVHQASQKNIKFDEGSENVMCFRDGKSFQSYLTLIQDDSTRNVEEGTSQSQYSQHAGIEFIVQHFMDLSMNNLNNPEDLVRFVEAATTTRAGLHQEYFEWIRKTMDVKLIETIEKVTHWDLVDLSSPERRRVFFDHRNCSDDHDLRNLLQWIVDKNSSSSTMIPCCDYRKASDDQYNQIASYITQNDTISDSSFQDKVLCLSNPKVLRDYLSFTARNNSQPQHPNESPTSGILDVPEMDFIIIRLLKILRNTLNEPDALIDFVSAAFTTRTQLKKLAEIHEVEEGRQNYWTSTIVIQAAEKIRWLEKNKQVLIDWTTENDRKLTRKL